MHCYTSFTHTSLRKLFQLLKKNAQTFHAMLIITIKLSFFFILPHLRVFPVPLGIGIAGQASRQYQTQLSCSPQAWPVIPCPAASSYSLLVKEHKRLSHTYLLLSRLNILFSILPPFTKFKTISLSDGRGVTVKSNVWVNTYWKPDSGKK